MPRYEIETLVELTGLEQGVIYQCVERHLVVVHDDAGELELDEAQVARLRRIRRLMEEFELNLDALELVLSLRDELERRGARAQGESA